MRLLFAVAGFFSVISSLRANDITWQSLSMPTSAVGGTTITITAVVTNTGEDIWGGAHNLVMLDQNFTPVAMTSLDGVEPGQTVTVSFPYGFPDVAANYTFQFQALEHEVEYFGPVHSRTIAVSKAPPYEGMQLTPTTFDALAPALISTTDTVVSFPAYRLRAKVIDGTSWGWHAANRWNTNNYPLDNPPPPGNYTTCALYWVRYTSLYGNVLLPIGPERTVPISVQGTVSLSTNWAHASNPPKIYTSENMAGTTYRLFATFRNSAGAAWETSSGYNNQGASLANLPPPGSYQVDLQWKKYDPSMNVTAASAVRTANVSITDGPIVVLNADSFISGTESYNEEDGTSSIDYSVNSHDISQILVGGVLKVRGQAQDGGQLFLNAYTLSGQPLQSGIPELALPVSPGDYRITVTADREVSYSVVGELFPYAAGLSITSIDSASGSVGTAFAGYAVTTDGTGPIVYSAPAAGTLNGLPPGLTLQAATGVISGTPTAAGIFRVWITASNAAGSGYKWVTFTITKGTPSMNFSNQTYLNEHIRYITPGMLAATVTGVAGGVAPVTTGGSAVTYRITQGTVSAPTGSNPLGRYLTPWYSPITVLATYPGDANYEAATKSAVFEILVRYTPSTPSALRQVLIGPNSFSVEWQRSTGEPNTGISPDTYEISFDGGATIAKSVTSGQNSAVFNGYTPSTTYHLTVRGRDAFGNVSGWSAPLTVTTLAAGTTATYTPRWLDVNGDGLPDEVIDAGTSVFSHFVGEESTVDVTYSTWALDWSYIAGLNFNGSYYYDGYGGIFYVPGPWIPTWEEVEETISVPVVRPVFRFVAEAGYGYRIGRLSTRSNGQIVFSEVYSITGDETVAGINEWWPPEMMAQSAYFTLPFVAVRLSRGLGSVAIGSSSVTLGGSRGAGGVLTAALGGGGGVTLNVLDTVNRLIKPGMGIVWEVWNGASQILNGATLGGLLNLGINSSGQFQVGLKLSDSTMLWFNLEVQEIPPPRLAVDANRDGTITFGAADATDATRPYRFWVNDDDDDNNSHGASSAADASNSVVDGADDLADFFPVFLDIKNTLQAFPPGGYSYKLKQVDGALNFAYSNLTVANAFAYRTANLSTGFGDNFTDAPSGAAVHQITAAGHTLSDAFLVNARDNDQGVLLMEARGSTTAPLVLEVAQGNSVVAQAILPLSIKPRILLLLHGINSNTATWNAVVTQNFGDPATNGATDIFVELGGIQGTQPKLTVNGVRCYRLQFGAFESATTSRTGLESVSTTSDPRYLQQRAFRCGDFQTFAELGREIDDAITLLLQRHPNAEVVLLGHSRGGISARAFLQAPNSSAAKAATIGMLTTGSPHLGTRMGRIYEWLETHRRDTPAGIEDDWEAVDQLRNSSEHLDVRRPVTRDLASGSAAIAGLNTQSSVANLPSHIKYGEIVYYRADLGFLGRPTVTILGATFGPFEYRAFDNPGQNNVGEQFSEAARNFILGEGRSPTDFPGDGLIPGPDQVFTQLPGFAGVQTDRLINTADVVIHTDEPGRTADLNSRLRLIVPDWFP